MEGKITKVGVEAYDNKGGYVEGHDDVHAYARREYQNKRRIEEEKKVSSIPIPAVRG